MQHTNILDGIRVLINDVDGQLSPYKALLEKRNDLERLLTQWESEATLPTPAKVSVSRADCFQGPDPNSRTSRVLTVARSIVERAGHEMLMDELHQHLRHGSFPHLMLSVARTIISRDGQRVGLEYIKQSQGNPPMVRLIT